MSYGKIPPRSCSKSLLFVGMVAVTLFGCENPVTPEILPSDGEILARVDPGAEVWLLSLGESGHAAWVKTSRAAAADSVLLAHEGEVSTLPIEWSRVLRRVVFVSAGGDVLGPGPRLYSGGEIRDFEAHQPVGFTADGLAWMSTSGSLVKWDGVALHETGRPRGEFVAPDGGIVYRGRQFDPSLSGEHCVLEHSGERETIFIPNGCSPVAIASGGVAVLSNRFIWADGSLTPVDDMRWELSGPRVDVRLVGINRHADAVGLTRTPNPVPVLVSDGAVRSLNSLDDPDDGWMWIDVGDINDRGEILALGRNDVGETVIARLELGSGSD